MLRTHLEQGLPVTEKFDFYDCEALMDRLVSLREQGTQVTFVVGSGLTSPAGPGQPGVPSVAGVIHLIRESFSTTEQAKFDAALSSAANPYQEAFRFLLGRRGQKAANGIIKKAVALARRPSSVLDNNLPAYEITTDTADESCRGFDHDYSGWILTPGVEGLGRLVAMQSSPFGRMVLTTNFDPLIGASIALHGGSSFRSFLYRDGSLSQTDGPGTHIVHLHGYWYGSDTLHTPQQLLQDRPQLKASLAHLLRGRVIVVMAYGGWDDAFTQTMMSVVLEDSSFPEIIWCFFDIDPHITPHFLSLFQPGLTRGSVTLYSGVDVHRFLPALADAWGAARTPVTDLSNDGKDVSDRTTVVETTSPEVVLHNPYRGRLVEAIEREDNPPFVEFLVGRDEDAHYLRSDHYKAAFITGFGGQGKSALVAQFFAPMTKRRDISRFAFGVTVESEALGLKIRLSPLSRRSVAATFSQVN
jgi:hypothetical protein